MYPSASTWLPRDCYVSKVSLHYKGATKDVGIVKKWTSLSYNRM